MKYDVQLCQWSRFAHIRLQSFSISLFWAKILLTFPIWSTNLKLKLITIIVIGRWFLVFFSFFEKTTYCCRARCLSARLSVRPSVRPSVCPSVRLSVRPSVRPSVEIISFRVIRYLTSRLSSKSACMSVRG